MSAILTISAETVENLRKTLNVVLFMASILLNGSKSFAVLPTTSCADAMGTLSQAGSTQVCLCPSLRRQIDLKNQNDINECTKAALAGLVSKGLSVNGTASCESGDATHRCGHSLINEQIAQDRKSDLLHLIGTAESKCDARGKQSSQNFQDPKQLESYMATQAPYDFGAKPDVVSSCFQTASKEDQNQAISKYYYLNNRIKNADLISLSAFASINSILGKPMMDGLTPEQCNDYLMKERSEACDFYKQKGACKPAGGLDDLVHQTQDQLRLIDKMQANIQAMTEAKATVVGGGTGGDLTAINKTIAENQDGIDRIKNMFPWIGGKAFNESLKWYKKNNQDYTSDGATADLITKQFLQDRNDLKNRMDRFRQATSCLNNESEKLAGHCKDFEDTIDDTPDLNINTGKRAASTTGANAQAFESSTQCRWAINKDKKDLKAKLKQTGEAVGVIALTTAATVFTGGTAGVALLGEMGGVMATAGIDIAFAVKGAKDAYGQCKEDLYKGSKLQSAPPQGGGLSCPISPASGANGIPNVTSDMHACIMHQVAAVAGALPLLRYAHFINGTFIKGVANGLAEGKAATTGVEQVAATGAENAGATAARKVAATGAEQTSSTAAKSTAQGAERTGSNAAKQSGRALADTHVNVGGGTDIKAVEETLTHGAPQAEKNLVQAGEQELNKAGTATSKMSSEERARVMDATGGDPERIKQLNAIAAKEPNALKSLDTLCGIVENSFSHSWYAFLIGFVPEANAAVPCDPEKFRRAVRDIAEAHTPEGRKVLLNHQLEERLRTTPTEKLSWQDREIEFPVGPNNTIIRARVHSVSADGKINVEIMPGQPLPEGAIFPLDAKRLATMQQVHPYEVSDDAIKIQKGVFQEAARNDPMNKYVSFKSNGENPIGIVVGEQDGKMLVKLPDPHNPGQMVSRELTDQEALTLKLSDEAKARFGGKPAETHAQWEARVKAEVERKFPQPTAEAPAPAAPKAEPVQAPREEAPKPIAQHAEPPKAPPMTAEDKRMWSTQQGEASIKVREQITSPVDGSIRITDQHYVRFSIPEGPGKVTTIEGQMTAIDKYGEYVTVQTGPKTFVKVPMKEPKGMSYQKFAGRDAPLPNEQPVATANFKPMSDYVPKPPPPSAAELAATRQANELRVAQNPITLENPSISNQQSLMNRDLKIEPITGRMDPSTADFLRGNQVRIVGTWEGNMAKVGDDANGLLSRQGDHVYRETEGGVTVENAAGVKKRIKWSEVNSVNGGPVDGAARSSEGVGNAVPKIVEQAPVRPAAGVPEISELAAKPIPKVAEAPTVVHTSPKVAEPITPVKPAPHVADAAPAPAPKPASVEAPKVEPIEAPKPLKLSNEDHRMWDRQQSQQASKITDERVPGSDEIPYRDQHYVKFYIEDAAGKTKTVEGVMTKVDKYGEHVTVETNSGAVQVNMRQPNGMAYRGYQSKAPPKPGEPAYTSADFKPQSDFAPKPPPPTTAERVAAEKATAIRIAQNPIRVQNPGIGATQNLMGRELKITPLRDSMGPTDRAFLNDNSVRIVDTWDGGLAKVGQNANGFLVRQGGSTYRQVEGGVTVENAAGEQLRLRWSDIDYVNGGPITAH